MRSRPGARVHPATQTTNVKGLVVLARDGIAKASLLYERAIIDQELYLVQLETGEARTTTVALHRQSRGLHSGRTKGRAALSEALEAARCALRELEILAGSVSEEKAPEIAEAAE